ncbi:MAG: hypothetical protein LQ349_007010 [Xanthoria aureola]|nr:MAG: hypothetical protein LQ349_007010 [Xanthoria aureola]
MAETYRNSLQSTRVFKSAKKRRGLTVRPLALHNRLQDAKTTLSEPQSKGDDDKDAEALILSSSRSGSRGLNIVQAVQGWIQSHPNINSAPRTKGGWERWVQMDICLTLRSAGYKVTCEDKCYEDKRLRCDLLIHHSALSLPERLPSSPQLPHSPTLPEPPMCGYYDVVEIKCQLVHESIDDFYSRFKKDIRKLMDKPLKEPLHNWTTQRWAIGLSVVPLYRTNEEQKAFLDQAHWGFWHGLTQIHCHNLVSDRGLVITAWHTSLSPAFEEVMVKSCLYGAMD